MDIERLLFGAPTPGGVPDRRSLLLAEPLMQEPYFRRSVVLLLERDPSGGYIGLTLNKQADLTMADLVPGWERGRDVEVFSGGPVDEQRLFMLHTLSDVLKGSREILPGLFVGGTLEDITTYIEGGGEIEGKMRFFLGYSGWDSGQLEKELLGRSWAVADAVSPDGSDTMRLIDGRENDFWRREVNRLGEDYRSWLVVPETPWLN